MTVQYIHLYNTYMVHNSGTCEKKRIRNKQPNTLLNAWHIHACRWTQTVLLFLYKSCCLLTQLNCVQINLKIYQNVLNEKHVLSINYTKWFNKRIIWTVFFLELLLTILYYIGEFLVDFYLNYSIYKIGFK